MASARASLAKRDYEGAVRILKPRFGVEQPAEVRDDEEWVAYLVLLEESQNLAFRSKNPTPSEMDKYRHWPAMHQLGLAWHFHMKHAITKNDKSEALRAFRLADTRYESVIDAASPASKSGQEWRVILVGLAMENRATIRKQLASFTNDQALLQDAKDGFEACRDYHEKYMGQNSKGYLTAVAALRAFPSLARSK